MSHRLSGCTTRWSRRIRSRNSGFKYRSLIPATAWLVPARIASAGIGKVPSVADTVHQLLATEAALDKLGARGISLVEVEQLLRNRHAIVRNLRGSPDRLQRQTRRLLIGCTDGGRTLTFVIEATVEPTAWVVITGWEATAAERRMIEARGKAR